MALSEVEVLENKSSHCRLVNHNGRHGDGQFCQGNFSNSDYKFIFIDGKSLGMVNSASSGHSSETDVSSLPLVSGDMGLLLLPPKISSLLQSPNIGRG